MKATPAQTDVSPRKRIAALLRRMSQAELAAELGVSQPAISQWKAGATRPSGPAMKLLAQLERKMAGPEKNDPAQS